MRHEVVLFVDRLRMVLGRIDPIDLTVLAEKTGPYRCDQMFELGTDLSDTLAAYEAHRVNETVVREAAVAVAAEAMKVWLSTCGRGPVTEYGDERNADE